MAMNEKLASLLDSMESKKLLLQSFDHEPQQNWLKELEEDPILRSIALQAQLMREDQEVAIRGFCDQYSALIEKKVLPIVSRVSTPLSEEDLLTLRGFHSQILVDPILNVADPIWVLFLRVLANLKIHGLNAAIASCIQY